ncbi:MAG: beta-ketoacyl-[acyl-carrier-protein] synthase family protein [Elusimicrobia bacterium]|nr:beta-ketoacyl-[acyl-carrier-protein] synthase family protein [Elusimicrobiota bacterium]
MFRCWPARGGEKFGMSHLYYKPPHHTYSTGQGRSGVRHVGGLPVAVAAPVAWQSQNGLSRMVAFAMQAAQEAWRDAGLDIAPPDPQRVGCTVSASKPDLTWTSDAVVQRPFSYTGEPISPMWETCSPDGVTRAVAQALGIAGLQRNVVAACATGLYAVAIGASWIQHGECDLCVVGSVEASLLPLVVSGFAQMGVLAQPTNGTAPHRLARPFDRQRSGFVLGEGAGVLVLEEQEQARQRGARKYGQVLGWGIGCDPSHPVRSARDGWPIAQLIQRALNMAGIPPTGIHYINAHGTGTRLNDVSETRALKAAFGQQAYEIPISGTKAATGHLLGAAGSVELAFALCAKRDGLVPPTLNLDDPDPACDLDYTPRVARPYPIHTVLSLSFGFGGPIGAVIVGDTE